MVLGKGMGPAVAGHGNEWLQSLYFHVIQSRNLFLLTVLANIGDNEDFRGGW